MRTRSAVAAALLAAACSSSRAAPPDAIERVRVSVTVPTPCWKIQIRKAYTRDDELLVVSELVPPPPDAVCIQVVAVTRDEIGVRVRTPRPHVRHLVLDPTAHGWSGEETITFVRSRDELERKLEGAEPLAGIERGADVAESPDAP